jgi:hypothetical protein
MARSYQVACPPGSAALVADLETTAGGARVTVQNTHASEILFLGGDENQLGTSQGGASLTDATGYRLTAGSSLTVTLNGGEAIYGRSNNATVTISASVFRSNFRS